MGASMMGPDYTQWHGNFDLAENFYTKMIPEIEDIIDQAKKEGKYNQANNVKKVLDDILNSEMHKWFIGKMSPEEVAKRKAAAKEFRKRYSN
jgi:hypothetical protein